jgi:lipoate-protein ligase A
MKSWRLIFNGSHDAFFNMALDEALLLSCQREASPPVLRLYQWHPPAVSVGYLQPIDETVDLKECRNRGIDVVRRITGGRAVLHEDEITYSVCASCDYYSLLGENTNRTYQRISMALLEGLRIMGIEGEWVRPSPVTRVPASNLISSKPCFLSNSRYEITVGGRKLIGSAQRRFRSRSDENSEGSFIQHGSILAGKGRQNLADLMPGGGSMETIRRSLREKSTNLEQELNRKVTTEEIIFALKSGFAKSFGCRIKESQASGPELNRVQSLVKNKYSNQRWNLRR